MTNQNICKNCGHWQQSIGSRDGHESDGVCHFWTQHAERGGTFTSAYSWCGYWLGMRHDRGYGQVSGDISKPTINVSEFDMDWGDATQ